MKAFRSIRDEMKDTAAFISHPYAGRARRPMERQREASEADEVPHGIEPWIEAAFEELIHAGRTGAPFVLAPCLMNDEPSTIIGFAYERGGRTHIRPLFLACQAWMMFTAQAEGNGDSDDGGGGTGVAEADRLTL
jgi:hypothetical protein